MAPRRFGRGRYVVAALLAVAVGVLVAAAIVLSAAKATLTPDKTAIAKVALPFGAGTIQSVSVVTGPHSQPVPVQTHGDPVILPSRPIAAGERLQVQVIVKRPGWISWLAGSTQRLNLTVTTPVASLRSHYVTLTRGGTLQLHFRQPISSYAYAPPGGRLSRHVLPTPSTVLTLPHDGPAGTLRVSAAPLSWERGHAATVAWFPRGHAASAFANPAPGATITPSTPITLTFSRPVSRALGGHLPPVSPASQGTWHTVNAHTIRFEPEGYGYGLDAKVHIALPTGTRLTGGQQGSDASSGSWTVPPGSTARLQQLLAKLNYLPLTFTPSGTPPALTDAAQEAAATNAPHGSFAWRYPNTPAALESFWQPGSAGTMTQGAVMAFESTEGLPVDGVAGPQVWKALIAATIAGKSSSFGYTFASVSVADQRLTLWHNGRDVIGPTPVNTGIASAPTATGTYPVYEHVPVTTMSGTNPDGSHYHDTGIPWVSYFHGGDALHGFQRAQYGDPQSLGCVEMPFSVAAQVYPYTPIGTLVHVA